MALADRAPRDRTRDQAGTVDALVLGLAQACALVPGISRNGATLAAARWRKFNRAEANALSRHVALPIILGATVIQRHARSPTSFNTDAKRYFMVGASTSFASTFACTWIIRQVERDRSLLPYAFYRTALATTVIRRIREESSTMSNTYAASGVDTSAADQALSELIGVLKTIELDRPSRSVLASGHYASVLRIAPNLGIALSTDGVGSKVIVAEQVGRFDTIGIDCIAMNVNDVICVGAEPIALLDYLAVEQATPESHRAKSRSVSSTARSWAASILPRASSRNCRS